MKRIVCAGLILLALLVCAALGEEARDVTDACAITASNTKSRPAAALDGDYTTYWEASKNGSFMQVEFPEGETAGGIQVEWFAEPKNYELTQFDADGNKIKTTSSDDGFKSLCTYFELEPETRKAKLACAKETRVCGMHVYTAGELPSSVQVWQPPVEKADILLLSTHQDDEILWFGGAIPYYSAVREVNMQVVYMVSCRRLRRAEALSGLWVMGMRNYPEFLGFKDAYPTSVKEGIEQWGGKYKIVEKLVQAIRRYKPEVVLCQDVNGEYGHKQHKITSTLLANAVLAAADPDQYEDSYKKYGAWQVKKVYRHLGDENVIYMDWNTPSEKLGGLTPLESAAQGFAQHASQQKNYSMDAGTTYDNTKFSLVYSTVGEDVYKDDFLENTDADPRRTPEPSTAPTAAPTVTPSPTVTPEPTATPEPTETPKAGSNGPSTLLLITGAALCAAGIAALFYLKAASDRRKRLQRRKRADNKKGCCMIVSATAFL